MTNSLPATGGENAALRTVELLGPDRTVSLAGLLDALHRKGNRMPVHLSVYITHQLARGLRHIHQNEGRAHGEVKAENVLLLRSGQVRLIDRRANLPGGDQHADLTGVGRLAWEMLVGWPVDEGDGARRRPAPLAPSLLRSGLPGAVDDLVLRALELDPHRRYAGPSGLANDCARFLATRPDPRRGLRLLLDQLFGQDERSAEDASPTRLTAVPWRDAGAMVPPPPAPSQPKLRVRWWWQPWMTRTAVRVAETTVACLLALLALRALEGPLGSGSSSAGAARPATVVVPLSGR